MRKMLLAMMAVAAAGVAGVATSAPAHAGAWCVQGRDEGIPGDCSYSSYAQCQASASGRNAYCNVNPRYAFGGPPPRAPRARRGRPFDPYEYYR